MNYCGGVTRLSLTLALVSMGGGGVAHSDLQSFITSNIPIKNTLGSSTVVSCACKISLFSVAFYLVRAVHKFNFRLVIKSAPNKWQLVVKRVKPFAVKLGK
jgi:hypothetical protein